MTVFALAQHLAENDRIGVGTLTVDQAADVLEWMRSDDENGSIPDEITAADLVTAWNEIKDIGPRNISIDNGATYCTPEEAINSMAWNVIVTAMDYATCMAVHNEMAPCTDVEFLKRYLAIAPDDLIVG